MRACTRADSRRRDRRRDQRPPATPSAPRERRHGLGHARQGRRARHEPQTRDREARGPHHGRVGGARRPNPRARPARARGRDGGGLDGGARGSSPRLIGPPRPRPPHPQKPRQCPRRRVRGHGNDRGGHRRGIAGGGDPPFVGGGGVPRSASARAADALARENEHLRRELHRNRRPNTARPSGGYSSSSTHAPSSFVTPARRALISHVARRGRARRGALRPSPCARGTPRSVMRSDDGGVLRRKRRRKRGPGRRSEGDGHLGGHPGRRVRVGGASGAAEDGGGRRAMIDATKANIERMSLATTSRSNPPRGRGRARAGGSRSGSGAGGETPIRIRG